MQFALRAMPVGPQALLVQIFAVAIATVAEFFLARADGPELWRWVVIEALAASVISAKVGQPRWWWGIHLVFLPAAFGATSLTFPPWMYLGVFVGLTLVYWGNARTRVPLYLSSRRAWQAVLEQLPEGPFRFVDLGSGVGGLPLWLQQQRPDGEYTGIEIAPVPWALSDLRARHAGSPVEFLRGDYATLNLADYDVAFAFLSPAAMPGLWTQVQCQMRPGSRFISLSFDGMQTPDKTVTFGEGGRHRLYIWTI